MRFTFIAFLGAVLAALIFIFTSGLETDMAKPPKSEEPEEAAGGAAEGENSSPAPTPDPGENPEHSHRSNGEQGIGMPTTREDMRRLKEEADKPDAGEEPASRND